MESSLSSREKAAMQQVTVLGTGVLGSQIIFQTAYSGKDVVAYDISDEILSKLPARWEQLKPLYLRDLPDATPERLDAAVARIRATSDLADAVSNADIVIEAVPERLDIKRDTWQKVSASAPEKTVFTTNSSTLLPSDIVGAVDRPAKFLALHFANEIWRNNTGEVMAQAQTDPAVFEQVAEFAEEIGMIAIRVKKEQPGYVLNSLLVPLLDAASDLWVRGVADIETIDMTWRKATGAPLGPFQIFDVIGMVTPYNLNKDSDDPVKREFAERLKSEYIDEGRLGVATGRGFYEYGA
jgi:3-hydroxybutyryl-CoA dehydrogenase